jgi:uncharacterized protein (TIGR02145 family)
MYQWGRKDPFLGASSVSESILAASTLNTWPITGSNSDTGTEGFALANPTTFITKNEFNGDWYYTGTASTDNTRWSSSKTIYDPCPAGWRVPYGGDDIGVWNKALNSSGMIIGFPIDNVNHGMHFSSAFGASASIWYPFSGCRNPENANLESIALGGHFWSSTPDNNQTCTNFLLITHTQEVHPSGSYNKAYGHSVRCMKE